LINLRCRYLGRDWGRETVNLATVLTLVVSLGALVGTVTLGLLRFRHERELANEVDARAVLAETALELGRMKGAMKDALSEFGPALSTGENWPDDMVQEMRKFEARIDALEAAQAAVRIRFKRDHPVVAVLDNAIKLTRKLRFIYRRMERRAKPQGGEVPAAYEEEYQEAFAAGEQFDAYVNEYLDAAQKSVGVDLEGEIQFPV
jgi:hypothetical protein